MAVSRSPSAAALRATVNAEMGDTTMWDPRTTGTWITTDVDTVIAIRQQYHP